jgi:hypothetical protein
MSRELIVGPDATNATEQLYDLVGDDQLFDQLEQLAARDARANIWADTDIQARLAELGIQLPADAPADPGTNAEPDPEQTEPEPVQESRTKELAMDLEDPLMSDEEFETKYGDSRANMQGRAGRVQDRQSGEWYDPAEKFDQLKNSPEFQSQMQRMARREGMAEGDAPIDFDWYRKQQQRQTRAKQKPGVAEGEANAGETLRSQIIKLYKRGLEDYDIAYDLDIDEKIVADIIDDYDRKQQQRRAKQQGMAESDVFRRHGKILNPTIPELEEWIKNLTGFHIGGNLTDAGRAKVAQRIAKAQRILAKKKQQQQKSGIAEDSDAASIRERIASLKRDLKAVTGNYPGDDRNRMILRRQIFDLKAQLKAAGGKKSGVEEGSTFPGPLSDREWTKVGRQIKSSQGRDSNVTSPHQRSDWYNPNDPRSSKQQKLDYLKSLKESQGVTEAIPYALSAANANAEHDRTRTHIPRGYTGRVDTLVSDQEEYRLVMKTLKKFAQSQGQHVEVGLSGNDMSIYSKTMDSDELSEFVDTAMEDFDQGMAEASKEKTPGVALSKAYQKDFDGIKPVNRRPETALTGTYSKTGKPGGELKKRSVAEGYPKHQDLSGISTEKLKAYLAKQSQQQVSGEGNQVKRVRAELQRRSQGVSEGRATYGPITDQHKAASKKAFNAGVRDGKAGAEKNKEYMSSELMKTTYLNGYKQGKPGVSEGSKIPTDWMGVPTRLAKNDKKPIKRPSGYDEYIKQGAKQGFQDDPTNPLRKKVKEQGVAEGGYPEVDHMPGPTIKRTQTGCKRCHGKGYVYKTPDGETHPMNRPDAKKYKCGKCDGIGFVKLAEQSVAETNVEKYKDLGATNQTTHFIKNVTTGKIVSPHRSLADAENALVGNERDSNDQFKIVRARKPGMAEGVDPATYPARAREAHEKYLKYENMVDQELRKLGQRLPQSWDAARMHQKLSSDAKYALALKYYDLSEKFASLSIRYEELAKKRGITESLLDEFVEGLNGDPTEQGMAESIPDVDHMHGDRGINLSVADTRDLLSKSWEIYGNYEEWSRDVDRVNSELLDDNADYTTTAGGEVVSINNKRFAAWSNRNGNGDLDIALAKKYSQQDVAEAGGCNHTMEGEMCPEHGLAECGMHESQVAESQEGNALLARIKSLALLR